MTWYRSAIAQSPPVPRFPAFLTSMRPQDSQHATMTLRSSASMHRDSPLRNSDAQSVMNHDQVDGFSRIRSPRTILWTRGTVHILVMFVRVDNLGGIEIDGGIPR